MSNTAIIEKVENTTVNVQTSKVSNWLKGAACSLAIFLGMFIVGIFVTKGLIGFHLVSGIEVEKLVGTQTLLNLIFAGLILWSGTKGSARNAIAIGSLASLTTGAVAYAVCCVVLAC